MNLWRPVSLNRSGRPILEDGENGVFVREHVGLYQGRLKVVDRQDGRVYLTNRRIIYVDNARAEHSLGMSIGHIERFETSDGFLRASPKVKVFVRASGGANAASGGTAASARLDRGKEPWICMICTFSNASLAAACASCGIKRMELKGASAKSGGDSSAAGAVSADAAVSAAANGAAAGAGAGARHCPHCTFLNHPSMSRCEMCGAPLAAAVTAPAVAPSAPALPLEDPKDHTAPYFKLSFRKGGDVQFAQLLQEQLDSQRWDALAARGNINKDGTRQGAAAVAATPPGGGIHAIEQLGEQQRKLNELVLSSSLEDLEQLMYKAQDLIALSSSFLTLVKPAAVAERLTPPLQLARTSKLYHRELARHISEYLHGVALTKPSAMVTTQDLFAAYNRHLSSTQGFGTELVLERDLTRAVAMFAELDLPFRRKRYDRSGLVVVTPNRQDDCWRLVAVYVQNYDGDARGKTVADIAEHFGWSYAIAEEETDASVAHGALVVDKSIAGTFFFDNQFAALAHVAPI